MTIKCLVALPLACPSMHKNPHQFTFAGIRMVDVSAGMIPGDPFKSETNFRLENLRRIDKVIVERQEKQLNNTIRVARTSTPNEKPIDKI